MGVIGGLKKWLNHQGHGVEMENYSIVTFDATLVFRGPPLRSDHKIQYGIQISYTIPGSGCWLKEFSNIDPQAECEVLPGQICNPVLFQILKIKLKYAKGMCLKLVYQWLSSKLNTILIKCQWKKGCSNANIKVAVSVDKTAYLKIYKGRSISIQR